MPHVDGLSRSGHRPDPEPQEEQEQAELIQSLEAEEYIAEIDDNLDTDNLLRAQRADENLQQVAKWMAEGRTMPKADLKKFADHLDSLEERGGIMYQRYISNQELERGLRMSLLMISY